ncbi:MAG TPA: DUF1802 family protein [Planctomycetaceae bacterium]|nr:DUF1802 family protein [Planctomycetaceae bacterium]
MQPKNRFAFKEWAVICAALGLGRQSIILRKGGIHEGRAGFRVDHSEFWLFPTNFHQSPDDLTDDYRELWNQIRRQSVSNEVIPIHSYAVVDEVIEITDESVLGRLTGLHGWSDHVVHNRFHYRRPGLFVLLVRVYELPADMQLPNSPHFAGCRSWVDLPEELPTAGLNPVLSDADHQQRIAAMRERIGNRE